MCWFECGTLFRCGHPLSADRGKCSLLQQEGRTGRSRWKGHGGALNLFVIRGSRADTLETGRSALQIHTS
jgi:hypothetical protein